MGMSTWVCRIALGLVALGLASLAVTAFLMARVRLPGEGRVPAGYRRNQAVYVPMRDGVEIAVDIWLPPELRAGARVPVLMQTTRYWRAYRPGWLFRVLVALHLKRRDNLLNSQALFFSRQGFAVIIADARGSGASGGTRITELSPDEITDLGELIGWAARQPWSNGRVGTFGVSYMGNTAELAAASEHPALLAVATLYNDFDMMLGLARPGGVYDVEGMQPWSDYVGGRDRNDVCGDFTGLRCWYHRQLTLGVKPVDADPSGAHLATILSHRHNPPAVQSFGKPEFRDDRIQTVKGPISLDQITPYGLRARIEASGVPMMVWCGWLDAGTCDGSLSRYRNFKNPQQLVIGAYSHGGVYNVDPFLPLDKHTPPDPPFEERDRGEAEFFDHFLREDYPGPFASSVRYYTMGEGEWHTSAVWPPEGLTMRRYYLVGAAGSVSVEGADRSNAEEERSLDSQPPTAVSASDSYTVDFSTTTGMTNRWHTQLGGDVIYPDRAGEDKKLLTYTGAPLDTDVEITGSPVVTLEIASSQSDGALFVYLEDVSPEGRVTYITEGIFRVLNRKTAKGPLPYTPLGPPHSFLRADAEPLVPGQAAEISFALLPTSVVLRRGHRIRLALAGADSSMFERCPAEGTPRLTVYREKERSSYLDLPMRNR
jgi:putative CocE/NonD family hydrolase